jgi:hypothetical protein
MVERVTSNDEVAGSIPSEGIQATSNIFLHFFLVRDGGCEIVGEVGQILQTFLQCRAYFSGLASLEL